MRSLVSMMQTDLELLITKSLLEVFSAVRLLDLLASQDQVLLLTQKTLWQSLSRNSHREVLEVSSA